MTTDEVRTLLALAEAARRDDGRCTFACRSHPARPCLCGGVERRAALRATATPAVVAALCALLLRLEWSGITVLDATSRYHCAICGRYREAGHATDCEWAAALSPAAGGGDAAD
jgi:hypothetical protein